MKTKEDYIKEAEEIIIKVDSRRDEDPEVKVPHWLKLTEKLQWYFKWNTLKHYPGTPRKPGVKYDGTTCGGWVPNTEVVTIGGEVI